MKNKRECYFKMELDLLEELDKIIPRLGYASRSELFTAFAYCIIDKAAGDKDDLTFTVAKELTGSGGRKNLTRNQIYRKLRSLIDEMVKPVIAMKGRKTACESALDEIRFEFHERFGIWLTDDDIREGFYQYELMNKPALRDYQETRLCAHKGD